MTIIVTGFSGNTLCCTNEAHFYCRNDNLCCRPIPCSRLSFSSLRRTLFWKFNAMYNWEQHNASWRDCMRVITPIFKKWLLGSPLEVFVTIHKIIACLLNHIGVNPRDTRTWPPPQSWEKVKLNSLIQNFRGKPCLCEDVCPAVSAFLLLSEPQLHVSCDWTLARKRLGTGTALGTSRDNLALMLPLFLAFADIFTLVWLPARQMQLGGSSRGLLHSVQTPHNLFWYG